MVCGFTHYHLFKEFMDTKKVRFSPIIHELDNVYLNLTQIIRTIEQSSKTLYAHSKSMLSKEEVRYFHDISIFFDGNCRRNKKIINIYVLIKNILGEQILGWYDNKPVTMYTLKIFIKLIILFEQWPYKMCAIFQTLENYKDLLINLPDETDFNIQQYHPI